MFVEDIKAENKIIEWLKLSGLTIEDLDKITNGNFIIFGGACRDAFAGEESCEDIDILTYQKYEFLGSMKIKTYSASEYSHGLIGRKIKFSGKKDIDLLTPDKDVIIFKDFIDILASTDINVSGIGYCSRMGFIETKSEQIKFARRKCFKVDKDAQGYDIDRTPERINKLIKKDWLEFK